jgi:hypothetical protein
MKKLIMITCTIVAVISFGTSSFISLQIGEVVLGFVLGLVAFGSLVVGSIVTKEI